MPALHPVLRLNTLKEMEHFLAIAHSLGFLYEADYDASIRSLRGWSLERRELITHGAMIRFMDFQARRIRHAVTWFTDMDVKTLVVTSSNQRYTLTNSIWHMRSYILRHELDQ